MSQKGDPWECLKNDYAFETVRTKTVAVGMMETVQLVEANPGRLCLLIQGEYTASSFSIGPDSSGSVTWQWPTDGQPVTFSYALHGAIVQQAFFAHGGAGDGVGVAEVIRERKVY